MGQGLLGHSWVVQYLWMGTLWAAYQCHCSSHSLGLQWSVQELDTSGLRFSEISTSIGRQSVECLGTFGGREDKPLSECLLLLSPPRESSGLW